MFVVWQAMTQKALVLVLTQDNSGGGGKAGAPATNGASGAGTSGGGEGTVSTESTVTMSACLHEAQALTESTESMHA